MLDAAAIQAITEEARNCFLYEDAPEYIDLLNQGLIDLQNVVKTNQLDDLDKLCKDAIRAAHSIKGGAGISELPILQKLAHKLEDLLEAIPQGVIPDLPTAIELIIMGVEIVTELIEGIKSGKSEDFLGNSPLEITAALEELLNNKQEVTVTKKESNQIKGFVKNCLNNDLEACLIRLENNINQPELTVFMEECRLLGEALQLDWLENVVKIAKEAKLPLPELVINIVQEIRGLRREFLENKSVVISPQFQQLAPNLGEQKTELIPTKIKVNNELKETKSEQNSPQISLRIPVVKLNKMSNTIGELLIKYEGLLIQEKQLQQSSFNLKKRTQQLTPLREQVQYFYDKLSVNNLPQLLTVSLSEDDEFDALEFDQYTAVHSTLQQFQELMVQVQEVYEDLDLLKRDFQESLVDLRYSLHSLNQDLTESRLLNFGEIAHRFAAPLTNLSKRYNKLAELVVEGEKVLVDQAILEQLQTPFTHIIRNCFDHGIETPQLREKLGKSPTGKIILGAVAEPNQVLIYLADDGQGINLEKIYQKAVKLGLCQGKKPSENELLEFIFAPSFSTAEQISDLSGRGMGMDIVRSQIDKIGGKVRVETVSGKGTKFTIIIPLSLNILPLLLFKCQGKMLAIPSVNVLEIIALKEFNFDPNSPQIIWQNQTISVYNLLEILPYNHLTKTNNYANKLALVVKETKQIMALIIDEIVAEKELVLKPLDAIIPLPEYVAGCTVLGTGEVVTILSPNYLRTLIKQEIIVETRKEINRNPHILIVDDSLAVRRSLNRLLTQVGYQVVQCRDGKEAWTVLNSSNQLFNLVISDIEMPELDGFSLLKMIRNEPKFDQLPVAMLTSRDNDLHRQKATDLGANQYFTKPFQAIKLLENVEQLIVNYG